MQQLFHLGESHSERTFTYGQTRRLGTRVASAKHFVLEYDEYYANACYLDYSSYSGRCKLRTRSTDILSPDHRY